MYNFHQYFRAGASLDVQYDESANIKEYEADYNDQAEHRFYRPPVSYTHLDVYKRQAEVLAANVEDLSRMDPANPKYDRLKLTEERLAGIAGDMKNVASLPSPLGKLLSETTRPNGMVIRKMTVPFGVIGVIYEARPNVTFDVFSLCFKSGNACVLKGRCV